MSSGHNREVIRCWRCGKELSVFHSQAGSEVECPNCNARVNVSSEIFGGPPPGRPYRPYDPPSSRKSPSTAAILNFFFTGGGYLYAGRGWGWLLLLPWLLINFIYIIAFLISGKYTVGGTFILLWLPIDLALAWHAYQLVREDQKIPR